MSFQGWGGGVRETTIRHECLEWLIQVRVPRYPGRRQARQGPLRAAGRWVASFSSGRLGNRPLGALDQLGQLPQQPVIDLVPLFGRASEVYAAIDQVQRPAADLIVDAHH